MPLKRLGIDIEKSLGAVTRKVTESEKDRMPVRYVTLERSYTTTSDDLWDAVTNPERLARFFSTVSGQLELGGRYQIEGDADGTITACKSPTFFAATWEFQGTLSWIEVRVTPEGETQARLTLSHISPFDEEGKAYWDEYGPGAGGVGWDLTLIGLEAHLSDKAFELSDGEAFMASDDGKTFIVSASEDWYRAAVEAGDNPQQAETAAKRTAALFSGEEPQES